MIDAVTFNWGDGFTSVFYNPQVDGNPPIRGIKSRGLRPEVAEITAESFHNMDYKFIKDTIKPALVMHGSIFINGKPLGQFLAEWEVNEKSRQLGYR